MAETRRFAKPSRPELDRLIEVARKLPPLTPAQRREQRISWVIGEMALEGHPIEREEAERVHDEVYGKPQ